MSFTPPLTTATQQTLRKIVHVDMDAFYASVEQRDDPALRGRPVVVAWRGARSVVCAASYEARRFGVRSAMPALRAERLCPEAVFVPPDFVRYRDVSRRIRDIFRRYTDLIEPLSLDEAYLDVTCNKPGLPSATAVAEQIRAEIREELSLTASAGIAPNKFLAKIASDLDKPHGFSVIGQAETEDFLAGKPVRMIWGVGQATQEALERAGIRSFDDLRRWDERDLTARFGSMGTRLWHLARGQDRRRVSAHAPVKSISNETTFGEDTSNPDLLDGHLWRMAEKVADRAKAKDKAGLVVTLKLKQANFQTLSRRQSLRDATQMADTIYRCARGLFDAVGDKGPYRLIGCGLSHLVPAAEADRSADLLDPNAARRAGAERATDAIRARFGPDAILKGRALR